MHPMVDREGDTGPYLQTERSHYMKISTVRTLAAFLSIIAAQKIAIKEIVTQIISVVFTILHLWFCFEMQQESQLS